MRWSMWCVTLFLMLYVQRAVSQMVQCFTSFSLSDGTCSDELGNVSLDDCCMNPKYGYMEEGTCKSCRYAEWTEWSSWSACSVSCLDGVKQRRRSCYGLGKCQDTFKHGSIQTKPCVDKDCCPENGGWSEWSAWQPCSVTCETGIKKRTRTCTEPPAKCDGSCLGNHEETAHCDTEIVCPTHGGWSSWGSWGPCMATCQQEGSPPVEQQRYKTCTNPEPSTVPRGNDCPGSNRDSQPCTGLPFCPVNGNWGGWSALSDCSVTCGVGRRVQYRKCDSPAPKHGGRNCPGVDIKTTLCTTDKNCPSDGHWSEWGQWSSCKSPNERSIICRNKLGSRRRERECLGRDHGGKFCPEDVMEQQTCYDIQNCDMKSYWSEWSSWSFCKPDCGEDSKQTREKKCVPDISNYREQNPDKFSGKPNIKCAELNDTNKPRPCFNLPQC